MREAQVDAGAEALSGPKWGWDGRVCALNQHEKGRRSHSRGQPEESWDLKVDLLGFEALPMEMQIPSMINGGHRMRREKPKLSTGGERRRMRLHQEIRLFRISFSFRPSRELDAVVRGKL